MVPRYDSCYPLLVGTTTAEMILVLQNILMATITIHLVLCTIQGPYLALLLSCVSSGTPTPPQCITGPGSTYDPTRSSPGILPVAVPSSTTHFDVMVFGWV